MKKIILILLSLLLVSTLIDAQTRNFGLDPKEDSLFIAQMREKMAKIRETRPTIALVLSGGGAKGAAHIGVIDYIEKLGIPIDMVLGTSMGGLVGGLYAVGYSPEQLETIITGIDWGWALSDKVSRDKIAYSEKKYKEKFLISLPFFYDKRVFQEKKNQDLKFTDWIQQQEDIQWGASDDSPNQIMDNIKGSLPFGFVVGQNVNNTISSLTVGYQDEIDFSELPIPFICVATEMVGSNAKVWYKGKLNTALRSTMSIPGLFSPIKKDGMVLVDGGMRNNYPVDIAKYLGADFVIGVDLSEGYINYASMNNVFDLFMQAIDMLGREAYEKNKNLADITIKPDITGYNMMSFDKASINTLMQRGWEGAEANSSDLRILKDLFNKDTLTLNNRPAINLLEEKISIS